MNILLLGSGGREHALAWKLCQSPLLTKLFIAPGNAGTTGLGTNLNISPLDFPALRHCIIENHIEMLIVGPEDPLVSGITDFFKADPQLSSLPVIGPGKDGAKLEGSKDFAKQFMVKYKIPTAGFQTCDVSTLATGIRFLETLHPPYVLKADGLAAGKGVIICHTLEEARSELTSILRDARFGDASRKVVIEEFMRGIEVSMFVITDGITYKILPEAKDYKRIGERDTGPNTGGMGSVSPVSFVDKTFLDKVENKIIRPTIDGLKAEGIVYQGFIFFGLMNVLGEPFVIEYNCRLGDPETESILPRIQNDLVELFLAVANKQLDSESILTDPKHVATVMLVSEGYPGVYEKGHPISGEKLVHNSLVFHAGTAIREVNMPAVTNGGRVLALTSWGETMNDALEKSYKNTDIISFKGKKFRRDIGFDLKIEKHIK